MRQRILLSIPVLAGLLASACATTRIGRLNADPTRYQGRTVRVEGTVTNSFGALGAGGYQVDDGTGKVVVISSGRGVPTKGADVRVKGRMQSGVTVMGKAYATTIQEYDHRVR